MPLLTNKDLIKIKDQEFLLQKRVITEKISRVLTDVEFEIKRSEALQSGLIPQDALTIAGKISRGENYKGLPYLVLDFPRLSQDNRIFIYRTMFWWGNYFICLLVSVNCHQLQTIPSETDSDIFINTGPTPWVFDLSESCWKPIADFNEPSELEFISLARKIHFDDYDQLSTLSRTTFERFMTFLSKKN